jgi:uncharacterized protein (DUF2236 family)
MGALDEAGAVRHPIPWRPTRAGASTAPRCSNGSVPRAWRSTTGGSAPDPPRTEAGLTARINAYRPELGATAHARDAARFLLLNPPLPVIARAPYAILAAAAVSLLPGWARRQLRLPRLPVTETVLVRPAGHAMVHAIRWAITARA